MYNHKNLANFATLQTNTRKVFIEFLNWNHRKKIKIKISQLDLFPKL